PARWDRGARQAVALHRRDLLWRRHTVVREGTVDVLPGPAGQVAEEQVLQRRDPQAGLPAGDQRSQGDAQPHAALVLDATVLDAQAVVPLAVALRVPAVVRLEAADLDRPRLVQRAADVA